MEKVTITSVEPPAPGHEPSYRRRLIVKYRDDVALPEKGNLRRELEEQGLLPSLDKLEAFGDQEVEPLFSTIDPGRLQALIRRAVARDPSYRPTQLFNYVALPSPRPSNLSAQLEELRALPSIESVSFEGGPGLPPLVDAGDDPLAPTQTHLDPAPAGIDARYAWGFPGGDGATVRFIDIEQGWMLDHEDLTPSGVRLVAGINKSFPGHGCAVLGLVIGADNALGIVGIAPGASKPRVVSEWTTSTRHSVPEAIVQALLRMDEGDVLLIEAQTALSMRPVETESPTFDAIRLATALGVTVIEAAGNGSFDLDLHESPDGAHVLDRDRADEFKDSGAVLVAAGMCDEDGALPLGRPPACRSNFGSRIDCHAQGAAVVTTWFDPASPTLRYTGGFAGTSAAAAIIAGAALSLQGIARARYGHPLSPAILRGVLRNATLGTLSQSPTLDRIGTMPDLRKIIDALP